MPWEGPHLPGPQMTAPVRGHVQTHPAANVQLTPVCKQTCTCLAGLGAHLLRLWGPLDAGIPPAQAC